VKQLLKQIFNKTPFYPGLKKIKQEYELFLWERKGKPAPPPHIIKQQTIRAHAKKFGLKYLVETGTYCGDMVEAMKKDFDRIYSIELSDELYEGVKKRFKGEETIELIHGDSGIELENIVNRIDQSTLFWLDGHYSAGVTARGDKDTPIYKELDHIFNAEDRGHVVIIDDARCFGADPAYPSIEELSDFVNSKRPDASIKIQDDSIRITPYE